MYEIDNEQLLDLYKAHGTTINVAAALRLQGYGISERTIRHRLQKAYPGYNKPSKAVHSTDAGRDVQDDANGVQKPLAGGTLLAPDKRRGSLSGKRFVFTAAQNNTYIHEDFFASLMNFCEHNDAQLIVSRFSYNKSGFQNSTKDDGSEHLWYDHRLEEFFLDESTVVADGLLFCGELDILPTASTPFSGLENYTQHNSGIIPHAKMQMVSLPRMKHELPRFLYSTGAVTMRNYIQRKAGQKAEFHHVFGALYVEVDDNGNWFARQLIADNSGCFHDLTTKYLPDSIESNHNVAAINWGDIHIEKVDHMVMSSGWGSERSMMSVLNPNFQFIHDLTDFRARNHHNLKDPYFLAEQYFSDTDSVEAAMEQAAQFLKYIQRPGCTVVVVESNHDLAFQRWLKEADVRQDPANAEYYHRMNAECYAAIAKGDKEFSIFEYALNKKEDLTDVVFLREDDSFVICNDMEAEYESGKLIGGIECGMHGHRGPNGARGSSKGFRNIGRKCNVGHSHSAGIIDGVYTAGVSCDLDMGYNHGPSSWSHSHIVTYPNGKRTIITMKNGKWRA